MRTDNTTAVNYQEQDKDTQYFPVEGIPAVDIPDVTSFPVHVFPDPFKSYIEATKEALNWPVDYTGTALLVAASVAIGNTAHLQVKPGYVTPPILFAACIGNPGASKTWPAAAVFKVFEEDDARERKRYIEDLKQYKLDLQKFNKGGKKAVETDEEPPEPPRPLQSVVLTQATIEALIKHLEGNRRGCVAFSDELPTFFESISAHSKGDNTSMLNSIFNGQSIQQHRIEVSRFVDDPFMNIIGGIQPSMLRGLFDRKSQANGLLHRFLFAYPDKADKQPINDNLLDPQHQAEVRQWFRECSEIHKVDFDPLTDRVKPAIIKLTPEAWQEYKRWQHDNVERTRAYGDSLEAEIINKVETHFARLCLILHVMNEVDHKGRPVTVNAVEAAAALCEYYYYTGLKVANLLQGKVVLDDRKANFFERLPDTDFMTAEAVEVGAALFIPERTVKEWLEDSNIFRSLFIKPRHGVYRKKVV